MAEDLIAMVGSLGYSAVHRPFDPKGVYVIPSGLSSHACAHELYNISAVLLLLDANFAESVEESDWVLVVCPCRHHTIQIIVLRQHRRHGSISTPFSMPCHHIRD